MSVQQPISAVASNVNVVSASGIVQPLAAGNAGFGTAAAPGAGVSFCSVNPNPAAGAYQIHGGFIITGAVETAANNIALVLNNVTFMQFPTAGGVNLYVPFTIDRFQHAGGATPFLKAVAAAAVSTVYTGWLYAVQIA